MDSTEVSPERQWWSVRAGEYVLGTLSGPDLQNFLEVLACDADVQAEVAWWEKRLHGLNETAAEKTPPDHVWQNILQGLAQERATSGQLADEQRGSDPGEHRTSPPAQAERRGPDGNGGSTTSSRSTTRRSWQAVAGFALAANLVLGVLLLREHSQEHPLAIDGVAIVLSDESGEPFFLVETDYDNLKVRVTALQPPSLETGSQFQLWQALPDRSAVRPVARLPEESGRASVYTVESLVDGSDLFGVSIEPIGAPTEAGPTGPVVAHGDFLKTRNP